MPVSILRLGHRIFRDQRISSHVFLTARALGAQKGFYSGEKDQSLEDSLKSTSKNWGGTFPVSYQEPKTILKKFSGSVVHLTAYGLPFQKKLKELRKQKNLLVIVGSEKVPPEIYQRADYNLSVGSQPHSEVSALGIFLYELQNKKFSNFPKPRLKIIPQERGKKVLKAHARKLARKKRPGHR